MLLMVQFMTRYPVPLKIDFTVDRFVAGMQWMPLVGFVVGLPAAMVMYLGTLVFGTDIAAFLALFVLITVTGGLHLDGIADTADGLFCYRPRERVLEIMRDSTLGANGVIAIVLTVLIKFLMLKTIPPEGAVAALIGAPAAGRTATVWHAAFSVYARKGAGLGEFVDRIGPFQALTATLYSVVLVTAVQFMLGMGLFAAILCGIALHLGTALVAVIFARYLRFRIGGITGDTIGATIELTEIVYFFLFFLLWKYLI